MLPTNQDSQHTSVQFQRLHQAKVSFNLAVRVISTSFLLNLTIIVLVMIGAIPDSSPLIYLEAASKVIILRCLQLAKDTNDRLDRESEPNK